MRRMAVALFLLAGLTGAAHAVRPDEVLADPALESRARALSADLRCMVCQNQNIDDSDADLARDLRLLVRERLVKGDTDAEALDYLVQRYGQFVLLKPKLEPETLLLWGVTPGVFAIGLAAAFFGWRSRRVDPAPADLAPDEQSQLDRLMHPGTDA